jgi:hypothetical protein
MIALYTRAAFLFLVAVCVAFSNDSAQAIQIGPRITCCSSHGPDIGGYKPFERPIPDKPLDGAKMAVRDVSQAIGAAGTFVWQGVTRPFVETWKFLSNPFAGIERWAADTYEKILRDATSLAYQIIKWLSIGFGTALALSIGLAMGLAAFLFRNRGSRPRRTRRARSVSR